MLEVNGKHIDTDAQGYLKNFSDWCEELVPILAKQEKITVTDAHWEGSTLCKNSIKSLIPRRLFVCW